MSHLFDLLDQVDWSSVSHAYGAATDTPALLKDLLVEHRSTKALDALFTSINHQGDQSEAGLYACPYLLELIKTPELPNLDRVLNLILGIAVGFPDDYLTAGERVTDYLQKPSSDTRRRPFWELSQDCYVAARLGVGQFNDLLDHKIPRVSWQAAYNLAWFPAESSRSLSRVREKLRSADGQPSENFANYLLACGLLEWHCSCKRASVKEIADYLSSSDRLTKYSAAIYCSWFTIDDHVVRVLRDLSVDEDFDSCKRDHNMTVFHNGDLMGYAASLLDRIAARAT